MEKKYKAVAYTTINKEEAEYGIPDYVTTETRYRIVSLETGEILDDAQGYGYKTAQKAYAGYGYKSKSKARKKKDYEKRKHVAKWLKEHKQFANAMDCFAFEIAKGSWGPDDKFDAKFVKQMLKDNNLEVDFSARDLLRVWQKGVK